MECERRMLATAQSRKVLSLYLTEAILEKKVIVPLWPDSGFNLLIDLAPLLKERGFASARAWALKAAENQQILVNPGDYFGMPNCIQICYAASPNFVEKFAELLKKALI